MSFFPALPLSLVLGARDRQNRRLLLAHVDKGDEERWGDSAQREREREREKRG